MRHEAVSHEDAQKPISVLFICMGNICRSPTAEAVFRAHAEAAGLADNLHIASAGTHAYHIGSPPDPRAQAAAKKRGYDLSALSGKEASTELLQADYVLVMDSQNLRDLERRFPDIKAQKFMTFAPLETRERYGEDVLDPYFGGDEGFTFALEMLEAASEGLLRTVQARLEGR